MKDGDPRAFALYRNHYSFNDYKDRRRYNTAYRNRYLICGPGEKMVLLTQDAKALFVWRKFIDRSGQEGVNCAIFRNEGSLLSSDLILEAEQLARGRWGADRFYTYVNPRMVQSANPGYCFLVAGWQRCGVTQVKKLIILENCTYCWQSHYGVRSCGPDDWRYLDSKADYLAYIRQYLANSGEHRPLGQQRN